MTEAEWLAATNPTPMLVFIRGKVSDRKGRLFGCGCCRQAWHLYSALDCSTVELGERIADGMDNPIKIDWTEIGAAKYTVSDWLDHTAEAVRINVMETVVDEAGATALKRALREVGGTQEEVWRLAEAANNQARLKAEEALQQHFADLLRCVYGTTLFRTISLDPTWRTEAVVALAEGIYADKAFDRMTVLADALEDAGCSREGILSHCRGAGPHVKGCWVVDLLTGRK